MKKFAFKVLLATVPAIFASLLFPCGEGFAHSDHFPKGGKAGLDPALLREIARCERELSQAPRAVPLRNRLALLYIRQGQASADPSFFGRAEALLERVLEDSGDQETLALHAWAALFRHDFRGAAARAREGLRRYPEASFFYGILSDACLETGDLPGAVANAQKMLDLRPDQGAYGRAAHLRSLQGDVEGAVELWRLAIDAGLPDSEDTAWCRAELGDEYFRRGKLREAEAAFREALAFRPGYRRGVDGLEKVRGQGRNDHRGSR